MITVFGSDILDAGTEANTESRSDTAFFGQAVPGTGIHPDPVSSFIRKRPGYIPNGPILSGGTVFLGNTYTFQNADFTQPGYRVAQVSIQVLPIREPGTLSMLLLGTGIALSLRKFRRNPDA
jgi:hypothetical protein